MKTDLVLNSSSSIFFTKVGLFPHIFKYFNAITSKEIYDEVMEGYDFGYKDSFIIKGYILDDKIKVVSTKSTSKISGEFGIKNADASIIALAQERGCFLATEDRQIEKICLATSVNVLNTAILIYLLWKKGEFESEQAHLLLDLLVMGGYNKEISLKIKEKIILEDRKNG